MRVLCINGHEGLLEEGNIYNVYFVTNQGNYLLEEVDPPDPFTSFDCNRFVPLQNEDLVLENEVHVVEYN